MLEKLFGKKKEEVTKPEQEVIVSPVTGTLIPIEEVPDPTFGKKMMGDGFAVAPKEGSLVAPVSGEVIQVFPTKHAIGIRTPGQLEILIHIGLDTVNLNGEGFTLHVKEGDQVKMGDLLVDFDLSLIKEKAASTITPVIITNMEMVEQMMKDKIVDVEAGQTPLLRVMLPV